MRLTIKTFFVWCLIVPLAIINGIFRELLLVPMLGMTAALPTSGLLLALLIFGLTWLFLPVFGLLRGRQYFWIGVAWLALTILFEFGFGRFIAGKSWHALLAAYDISSGNLWPAVLVVTALSPWLAAKQRRLI